MLDWSRCTERLRLPYDCARFKRELDHSLWSFHRFRTSLSRSIEENAMRTLTHEPIHVDQRHHQRIGWKLPSIRSQ